MHQRIIEEAKALDPVELGHKLNRAMFNKDHEEAAVLFSVWLRANNLELSMNGLQAIMFSSAVEVEK